MLLGHAARAAAQRTRVSCTVRHLAAAADTVTVSVKEARSTTAQALRMIGWDDEAADVQAEIMTAAELCGNNQGLVKMFNPSLMAPQPGAGKPVVERETATSAAINANQAPGMLAAVTASDLAAAKALENNVAVVSAYNTSTSSGQLAFYAERRRVVRIRHEPTGRLRAAPGPESVLLRYGDVGGGALRRADGQGHGRAARGGRRLRF